MEEDEYNSKFKKQRACDHQNNCTFSECPFRNADTEVEIIEFTFSEEELWRIYQRGREK